MSTPSGTRRSRRWPFELDFVWGPERFILEVDGFATHGTRQAFEDDRQRDSDHLFQGFRTMRTTYRQIKNRPERVLARLAGALAIAALQAERA